MLTLRQLLGSPKGKPDMQGLHRRGTPSPEERKAAMVTKMRTLRLQEVTPGVGGLEELEPCPLLVQMLGQNSRSAVLPVSTFSSRLK